MRYLLYFAAICGALVVGLAVVVKFDSDYEPPKRELLRIDYDDLASQDAELSATTESVENEKTDSVRVEEKDADKISESLGEETEKNTVDNKYDDNSDSKSDSKDFFIADAPYTRLKKVDDTSLVNINHRLGKSYEPNDLVCVYDYVDRELVTLHSEHTLADKDALLAFCDMMSAAEKDGVTGFYLRNVYRSYEMQEGLWAKRVRADKYYGRRYKVPLGSAYPGSSEHQTGLAFDILSVTSPEATENFKKTPNYKWLRENSYKFGFILRYPADKTDITGIKFEPYHYRYVGMTLAKHLYENGITLEEYYDSPVHWK
ncbi:MAG: M15 family metallopeptidase [Clostridia bacterium]|nr:M15 family metallopeptidase [Clostridia bacterium]